MNKKFEKLGFYPADILLPKNCDMNKWAVVACDQFTSEPEYWQAVEQHVGKEPSTLRLILPEANLKAPNVDEFIENINASMKRYMEQGILKRSRTAFSISSASSPTARSATALSVWWIWTPMTSLPAAVR